MSIQRERSVWFLIRRVSTSIDTSSCCRILTVHMSKVSLLKISWFAKTILYDSTNSTVPADLHMSIRTPNPSLSALATTIKRFVGEYSYNKGNLPHNRVTIHGQRIHVRRSRP